MNRLFVFFFSVAPALILGGCTGGQVASLDNELGSLLVCKEQGIVQAQERPAADSPVACIFLPGDRVEFLSEVNGFARLRIVYKTSDLVRKTLKDLGYRPGLKQEPGESLVGKTVYIRADVLRGSFEEVARKRDE